MVTFCRRDPSDAAILLTSHAGRDVRAIRGNLMGNKRVYDNPRGRRKDQRPKIMKDSTGGTLEVTRRKREQCKCGSGRPFGECCYRPYHTRFNLSSVTERLKNTKLRVLDIARDLFLTHYEEDPAVREVADQLTSRLDMSPLSDVLNDSGEIRARDEDPIAGAFFTETLLIDRILPSQKESFFQAAFGNLLKKRAPQEAECIATYGASQVELFEVVEVRRKGGDPEQDPPWNRLKNLFTGETFELKDPRLRGTLCIWDIVIGRHYTIDGFHFLSTGVLILTPHQRGVFGRLLLYFWWAWERDMHGWALSSFIQRYPELTTQFPLYEIPLDYTALCNEHVKAFLKADALVVMEICDLMGEYEELGTPVILAPDGHPVRFTEARMFLKPERAEEVLDRLKMQPNWFIPDKGKAENPKDFVMLFQVPREKPVEEINTGPSFNDMLTLSVEKFAEELLSSSKRVVVLSQSASHRTAAGFIKDLAAQNHPKNPHICGSVTRDGPTLLVFTYSMESGTKLKQLLGDALGDIILRIEDKEDLEPIDLENPGAGTSLEDGTGEFDTAEDLEEPEDASAEESNFQREEEYASAQMKRRFLLKQWERWLDEPLPILQDKTPRQAQKIPALRPRLMFLLKEREHQLDMEGEYSPDKSLMREMNLQDDQ